MVSQVLLSKRKILQSKVEKCQNYPNLSELVAQQQVSVLCSPATWTGGILRKVGGGRWIKGKEGGGSTYPAPMLNLSHTWAKLCHHQTTFFGQALSTMLHPKMYTV